MKCFKRRVVRKFLVLVIAVVCLSTAGSNLLNAAPIFESGTLGPTGISWQQTLDGDVIASSISSTVFTGVKFELNQPVVTTQIGGYVFSPNGGTFFGEIIELNNENDFPDSGDLSTPDVLGKTLMTFPILSEEVFGDLALSLNPGWYALVFGSGLYETIGTGGAVGNGKDIGNPSYIGYQSGTEWFDFEIFQNPFENFRFVVQGTIVPEPSSAALFLMVVLSVLISRALNKQLFPK